MTTEGETVVEHRGYLLLPVQSMAGQEQFFLVYDEGALLVGEALTLEGAQELVDLHLGNETDGDGIG